MNVYKLTDPEKELLTGLWSDTHNIKNATALDTFYQGLLDEGFTHTDEIKTSALSLGQPIEIHVGFVACL